MNETIHTEKYKGYTIIVRLDPWAYADPPDKWGNFTITMSDDLDVTSSGVDLGRYVDEHDNPTIAARAMLKSGRLWPIRYSSHGPQSAYRLGYDWETADGFIEFEPEYCSGMSKEARRDMAESDLQQYTDWANGNVYEVEILNPYGERLEDDGLNGGIYGDDYGIGMAQYAIDADIKWDRPARHAKNAGDLHR